MDKFIEWIQRHDYYEDQIRFQREVPARLAETRPYELNSAITARLADKGIEELYAHQGRSHRRTRIR